MQLLFFLCVVAITCVVFYGCIPVNRASYMYPEMVQSNSVDEGDEHHQFQCNDCKKVAELQTVDKTIYSTVKLRSRMPIVKIRNHRNTATDSFADKNNIATRKMRVSKPKFFQHPMVTKKEWLNVPIATAFDIKWNNLIKTTTNKMPNRR